MHTRKLLLDCELTHKECYDFLPEWDGLDIQINQLKGGITNKLYRIKSKKGDYTVRIYGEKTDLFINREHEAHTIQEMSKIGVCSNLVKFMPKIGITIVEFIEECNVLTNEHFLDEALYHKIVEPIRKIHTSRLTLKKIFNPLLEIMKMSAILKQLNFNDKEFNIQKNIDRLVKLSSIINIPISEYVPCHNDLLADNFLLINKNALDQYPNSIYIIDWEYAGMAPKYYDIADMFQEILIPREKEKKIVQAYCQNSDSEHTLFFVDLFKPFPDIYWFLWSLIQLQISMISFDYYSYGKIKYKNAIKNLEFLKKTYGIAT